MAMAIEIEQKETKIESLLRAVSDSLEMLDSTLHESYIKFDFVLRKETAVLDSGNKENKEDSSQSNLTEKLIVIKNRINCITKDVQNFNSICDL